MKDRLATLSPKARAEITTYDDLPKDLPIPDEELSEPVITFAYLTAKYPEKSGRAIANMTVYSHAHYAKAAKTSRFQLYLQKLKLYMMFAGELDPAKLLKNATKLAAEAGEDKQYKVAIDGFLGVAEIQQLAVKPIKTMATNGNAIFTVSWGDGTPIAGKRADEVKRKESSETVNNLTQPSKDANPLDDFGDGEGE